MDAPLDPPGANATPQQLNAYILHLLVEGRQVSALMDYSFSYATPQQLFAYLKLLGVEQRHIARQLGVSKTTVSLWATHHRDIPLHYRSALLEWAMVAWRHTLERHQKAAAALPTPELQQAAVASFVDLLLPWIHDVLTNATAVKAQALSLAQTLVEFLTQERLTAINLMEIHELRRALNTVIDMLVTTGGPPAGEAPSKPEGDAPYV
jgi:hypothetical protein